MAKPVYNALIIGVNGIRSNLSFFKKGDYPYKLRTFALTSVIY